jgi:hypothetical protein
VADVVAPMHMARQRYLVTPAALARPKESNSQKKKSDTIIIKYLIKKG